jgi:hypothetical protein
MGSVLKIRIKGIFYKVLSQGKVVRLLDLLRLNEVEKIEKDVRIR